MDKKGAIMQALIGIAILIVTFFIILQIYKSVASTTEGTAAEEFCYFTNAMKAKLIPDIAKEAGFSPQGCQKIEIDKAIPSKGATKEIGDLTARCWHMWLEGLKAPDGKSKDVLDASSNLENDCFICYTFFLEKGTTISSGQLSEALANEVYRVADGSDKCAPKGGGYCQESCTTLENPYAIGVPAEKVDSDKCKAQEKCCVSKVKGNDCLNKGGRCVQKDASINFFGEGGVIYARNNLWACSKKGESCFVKQSQFLSYVDYIQEGGKGPGMLALSPKVTSEGLKAGNLYAIAFNEDTSAGSFGGKVGGAVVGSAGCVIGLKGGAFVGSVGGPLGTAAGAAVGCVGVATVSAIGTYIGLSSIIKAFEDNEYDQILIAERSEVQGYCTVQYGVKG